MLVVERTHGDYNLFSYITEPTHLYLALHAAAMAGHATTVKLLLDDGAQIDCTDLMKHTPLFRACEMGHTDVVQTLMDCGAKVDVVDQDGRSPLHWYVFITFCVNVIYSVKCKLHKKGKKNQKHKPPQKKNKKKPRILLRLSSVSGPPLVDTLTFVKH